MLGQRGADESQATARKLGVNKQAFDVHHNGAFADGDYTFSDYVEIEVPGVGKIKAPALVSPGHADNSVSIALGYGRRRVGRVGRNTGFDAYPLRTDKTTYFATGVKVTPVAGTYQLVTTQQHQAMEGRNLVRELPIELYKKEAGFPYEGERSFVAMMGMDAHMPPNVSLYKNPPYDSQHQWGMAIDLNTCTGCNACVVACQSENNIPSSARIRFPRVARCSGFASTVIIRRSRAGWTTRASRSTRRWTTIRRS